MGRRHDSRVLAVQFLYQHDLIAGPDLDEALRVFWELTERPETIRPFAEDLVRDVLKHREELDEIIKPFLDHWSMERLAPVDRNILRLAVCEMKFRKDTPPVASINEAVETAKKLSTDQSGKFVNGVLDRVRKSLENAAS